MKHVNGFMTEDEIININSIDRYLYTFNEKHSVQ